MQVLSYKFVINMLYIKHGVYSCVHCVRTSLASNQPGDFEVQLQLPADLTCDHCVLQWTYITGMHALVSTIPTAAGGD